MWHSLQKLMALPDSTMLHCAHEYTLSNAKFALSVEPQNPALQSRVEQVKALRDQGLPTVPMSLELEKATNPFLRPSSPEIQKAVGLEGASLVDVFAEVRKLKDNF